MYILKRRNQRVADAGPEGKGALSNSQRCGTTPTEGGHCEDRLREQEHAR